MYKVGAIFSGLLIAIMVTLNGMLDMKLGGFSTLFIIHIIGLVSISLVLIIKKDIVKIDKNMPVYLFLGGAIGVVMILSNNACFKVLGISLTLALGILGQMVSAAFVDHYGLFGMTKHKFHRKKIIGFLIIIAGLGLMTFY